MMSKTIVSPVKRWPGTVVISDPLTYPQVFAWRDAIQAAQVIEGETEVDVHARNYALLPGILACTEEWHLEKFPENLNADNFPATPPASANRLLAWLVNEINLLFQEADEVPLA